MLSKGIGLVKVINFSKENRRTRTDLGRTYQTSDAYFVFGATRGANGDIMSMHEKKERCNGRIEA